MILVTRTARTFLLAPLALALLAAACGTDNTDDAVTAPAPTDAAAAPAAPTPAESPAAESAWPHEFQAPLIGGGTIDTGDYVGQDLVLWFWAPW